MASKREKTPPKQMRKIALVICGGETEVCYINLLKSWYKSLIRIISHIEGTKITPSLVEKRTKELKISQSDKVHTFLMYDIDVQVINEKLRKGGSINSQIRVEAIPFDSISRNQSLIRGPLLSIVFVYPLIDMLFLAI